MSDPAPEEESSTDNVVTAADEQPTYDSAETYTIKPGESLYRIAVMRGISLAELQRINNIDDPRKVRAGTVLKLPPARSTVVAVEDSSPVAPRPIAPQPSHERNQPEGAAAPAAETSGEPAATPVIINAPKQKERIASLEPTRSMSDAAPLLTTVTPNTEERAPAQDNRTAEQQADGVGKFRWPVRGRVIAGFGKQRDGTQSDGIKLAVPVGTEVHAAESGVVVFAGSELKDYGNLVLLRHDNGWITAYAHNDELMVKRGDRVRRGQVIAKAGKTGNAETPQLHFELRKGSDAIDPIPYLE